MQLNVLNIANDELMMRMQMVMVMVMMMLCFRKHRLYEDLYRCQYNLSGIYQRTGNLSQALRHVDVSMKCAVKMKDKIAERESLILKGKVSTTTTNTIILQSSS